MPPKNSNNKDMVVRHPPPPKVEVLDFAFGRVQEKLTNEAIGATVTSASVGARGAFLANAAAETYEQSVVYRARAKDVLTAALHAGFESQELMARNGAFGANAKQCTGREALTLTGATSAFNPKPKQFGFGAP